VHPEKIITNSGAKPGDILILTKPVGTGIINAAIRMRMASDADVDAAMENMKLLNRSGAEVMKRYGIRGATDITGFGLAGHALKMARASNVSIEISTGKIPLIGNVYDLTDEGCIPGASFRNLEYAEPFMSENAGIDYNLRMIAFDAQTSGGLLICADPAVADEILSDLYSAGLKDASPIGFVSEKKESFLILSQ
jgi:selenide,water dikinase